MIDWIYIYMKKEHHLHDGKKGTALAIRVIPRAANNEVAEVLKNGTVKIRLKVGSDPLEINNELIGFLSKTLNVPHSHIEVVAGGTSRSKLVSVLELDARTAQMLILQSMQ